MSEDQSPPRAPNILDSLIDTLRARFPEAQFAYRESPDRLRAYLDVATDCVDDFAVLETVADLTVGLLLDQGIMVHVFPFRHLPSGPPDASSPVGAITLSSVAAPLLHPAPPVA